MTAPCVPLLPCQVAVERLTALTRTSTAGSGGAIYLSIYMYMYVYI